MSRLRILGVRLRSIQKEKPISRSAGQMGTSAATWFVCSCFLSLLWAIFILAPPRFSFFCTRARSFWSTSAGHGLGSPRRSRAPSARCQFEAPLSGIRKKEVREVVLHRGSCPDPLRSFDHGVSFRGLIFAQLEVGRNPGNRDKALGPVESTAFLNEADSLVRLTRRSG